MKNLIGIVSIAVLAVMTSCSGDGKETAGEESVTPNVEVRSKGDLKIAYYVQDSITTQFTFYRTQDSLISKKQLAFQRELQRRQADLQDYVTRNEANARNGLLTQNQMGQIQQVAQNKEGELMQYQQQRGGELEMESMDVMSVITNKISTFSKEFCEKNDIDILMVYAQGGQVGFVNESMNVTAEFTTYLNEAQAKLESELMD